MNEKREGRACILESKETFAARQYAVPEPESGVVLIEMELCGICGTDVHYYHADLPPSRCPLLLGHENVGRIAALGTGIRTDFFGQPGRSRRSCCTHGRSSGWLALRSVLFLHGGKDPQQVCGRCITWQCR